MNAVYPVIFTKTERGYVAHVPDMDIDTQGKDLGEAIYMARDAIGMMGMDMRDDGKDLPAPSDITSITPGAGDFVSVVDIDFEAYRRARDEMNVSGALNEALLEKLAGPAAARSG
jgi:predicted RNase H-like HicB family nuclease